MTQAPAGAGRPAETLLRAARGLREASERWEPTRLSSDPDDMLIATTEVLWWLRSLDELLEERSQAYRQDLSADQDIATLMAGLRHARNRLGHRIARAIRVRHGGMVFPLVFPLVFFELEWVQASELDRYGGDAVSLDTEAAYHRSLEGRLVRHTVSTAVRWLLSRPELADTPAVSAASPAEPAP